jgi:hypothetical protein
MKKLTNSVCYLFTATLFFTSCKRENLDIGRQKDEIDAKGNTSAKFNTPQPIPILLPMIYFIEGFEGSTRGQFYNAYNLGGNIPTVTLLHTGNTSEIPSNNIKSNWYMNNKKDEIIYFANYVSPNGWEEYYERYSLNNMEQPPVKESWGDQINALKKYYGRGWVKLNNTTNRLYYLASSVPAKYPSSTFTFDQIRSANTDKSDDKVILEEANATWLAMDINFTDEKIYYTDYNSSSISVVGLDGKGKKTLIEGAGIGSWQGRRNIKVDPTNGKIYWIKDYPQSKKCSIMSASDTGDNITTLWTTSYQNSHFGIDFDIDFIDQKIFYCISNMVTNNGFASYLNRMDTDGKNHKVIYKPLGSITKIIFASPYQQN